MKLFHTISYLRVLKSVFYIKEVLIEKMEENKNLEITENILSNTVVFYPHIPKTVAKILAYRLKRNLFKRKPIYSILKRIGDIVRKGDVIAKYGPIEITAASDGKIVFLSTELPGKVEWSDSSKTVFSKESKKDDCFCVGIRIINQSPEPSEIFVRNFYNHGNVWVNMEKRRGNETVYTLIDHGLCHPDSYLPADLKKNNILEMYWNLINHGQAYTEKLILPI